MAEWPKKLTKEALREVVSHFVWSYWPMLGAPLMGAFFVYVSGYDWAAIYLGALFAFAMVALALNNFSQWMHIRSAGGKVDFLRPILAVAEDEGEHGPTFRGLKMGVSLRSIAPFPMEIRIDSLKTQVGDRVPTEAFFSRSVTVNADIAAMFYNGRIEMASMERANKVIHGTIDAKATYGRPGRVKYPIESQWQVAFQFDKNGNLVGAENSLTGFQKA